MKKVRIAVAGAGLIGHRHIEEIQKSPTCELASIVDPAPPAKFASIAHNAGVTMMFSASAIPGHAVSLLAQPLGSLMVFLGAVCYAVGQRGLIGKRRTSTRLEQGHWLLDIYPPLAFSWLIISLVLLAGGSIFASLSGQPLPHAFTGAVRHALTVGFMTTLILGVGQRLLPVLEQGPFVQAFLDKGRMSELVSRMPVHVIVNKRAALIGAAYHGLTEIA